MLRTRYLSLVSLTVASFTVLSPAWMSTAFTAQAQTSSGPVVNHPDSMQGSNIYDYYANTGGQGVNGGTLIGKISIAGDPLLWDPIPIHVTCLGKEALTSYTDSKGGFLLSATNVNGALSVQGDSKRQMETHLEGCVVTASLTGFTSSAITLTNRNFRDAADIGTITLTRAEGARSTALSTSSEGVSPKALKLYMRARSEWQAQTPDNVEVELKQAVEIDPHFAEAWYQLGRQQEQLQPEEARKDFEKAIAVDPQFIRPYEQILVLDSQQSKWKDVLSDAGQALKVDPHGTVQIWYAYAEGILKACMSGALPESKLKIAETSATNALHLDPQHAVPGTEQLLAVILAQEKNYSAAIDHLRNCLTYVPTGADADLVKQQIAKMEELQAATPK
jgi:cytochrome c-type biogenesis protein CcmH/NrfG